MALLTKDKKKQRLRLEDFPDVVEAREKGEEVRSEWKRAVQDLAELRSKTAKRGATSEDRARAILRGQKDTAVDWGSELAKAVETEKTYRDALALQEKETAWVESRASRDICADINDDHRRLGQCEVDAAVNLLQTHDAEREFVAGLEAEGVKTGTLPRLRPLQQTIEGLEIFLKDARQRGFRVPALPTWVPEPRAF